MYYEFAVTVPNSTGEATPVTQEMKLTHGVVTSLEIEFPAGCCYLAHAKVLHEESQKWPTPPSRWFTSEDHAIRVEENFALDAEPYSLKAMAYNEDDTYQHIIYFRVGILRGEVAVMIYKVFQGLEKMLKVMRLIQ